MCIGKNQSKKRRGFTSRKMKSKRSKNRNKPPQNMATKTTKYPQYKQDDLFRAVKLVRENNFSIYKVSKECMVSWSILKYFICKSQNEDDLQSLPKLGKPFALSAELEQRLLKYIITMQELGFGFSVTVIRKAAYRLTVSSGNKHPFIEEEQAAGYQIILQLTDRLWQTEILNYIYENLEYLLVNLGIGDRPDHIWNCNETGLSYVVKPSNTVTSIVRKYVYKRSYADREESHTLLGCVSASDQWIPLLTIFKGVRMSDDLQKDTIPGTVVKLSPKGWISVYHPFKLAWGKSLNNYMVKNPNQKSNRTNSHALMKPAFFSAFNPENILSSLKKTGISPLDRDVIPGEPIIHPD
ncbi:hypothetical protein PR048_008667 [Dryococelus australis]|uniref:HTH psq-type domain-containing protein n=1 Tax=Dryococelus australis TaxID=614101 RepID=A0ABQ9HXS0_9NEOP|nr:hypothetical protein PR048_008667 [Dryococelus australis]